MENIENSEGEEKRRKHLQYSIKWLYCQRDAISGCLFEVLMIFDFYYYWDCTIRQRLTSCSGGFRPCTLSTLFQKIFGIPMGTNCALVPLFVWCLHICICSAHISHCNWYTIHIDTVRPDPYLNQYIYILIVRLIKNGTLRQNRLLKFYHC